MSVCGGLWIVRTLWLLLGVPELHVSKGIAYAASAKADRTAETVMGIRIKEAALHCPPCFTLALRVERKVYLFFFLFLFFPSLLKDLMPGVSDSMLARQLSRESPYVSLRL